MSNPETRGDARLTRPADKTGEKTNMAERWTKSGDIWKLGMWRIVPSVSGGVHVYLGEHFKFFRGNVRQAKESVKRNLGFDSMLRPDKKLM